MEMFLQFISYGIHVFIIGFCGKKRKKHVKDLWGLHLLSGSSDVEKMAEILRSEDPNPCMNVHCCPGQVSLLLPELRSLFRRIPLDCQSIVPMRAQMRWGVSVFCACFFFQGPQCVITLPTQTQRCQCLLTTRIGSNMCLGSKPPLIWVIESPLFSKSRIKLP